MKSLGLILLSLFLVSCSHYGKHHKSVHTVKNWGNLKEVTHMHHHVYTAAQPNEAAIEAFKENKGVVVINLRQDSEKGFEKNEKAWVESRGITYYHVPVSGKKLSKAQFDKVEDILMKHKGKKTLVHCSSGNRAGAWFAYHAAKKHKDHPHKALSIGEKMGMTKPELKEQVKKMIK